jgi:hypothetical protein
MRSQMKIEKPGDVEVTLTVTMSADRWEKIRDWLRGSPAARVYEPEQQFASAIDDLLGQVRTVLWRDDEAEESRLEA